MIELFAADTPNGKKISIMLEEISYDYKVTKVDLGKGDQFKKEFRKISPFSKIPVIIDHKLREESTNEAKNLKYKLKKNFKDFFFSFK